MRLGEGAGGETGGVLLPPLLAAPVGCTAVIVGVAARSDPRLRTPRSSPALSPALLAAGGALAVGPLVDTWASGLTTPWTVVQVVTVLALLAVLVQDGRRAGYGAPPRRPVGRPDRRPPARGALPHDGRPPPDRGPAGRRRAPGRPTGRSAGDDRGPDR